MQNLFLHFHKQIPDHICNEIIKHGKSMPKHNGRIFQDDGNFTEDHELRDSQICWIKEHWILSILQYHAMVANKEADWNFNINPIPESAQYTTYKDNGHYDFHTDDGNPGDPRKLSTILMLSQYDEDYEGGQFQFYGHNPFYLEKGDIVVFPSRESHRVLPVTSGLRTSIITWTRGPLWR